MSEVYSSPAWLNGRLVDGDTARVSIFERGFTIGDGVFETVPVHHGVPVRLNRHLRRLREGCETMGLEPTEEPEMAEGIGAVLDASAERSGDGPAEFAVLRISITGGLPLAGVPGRGPWRGGPSTCVIFLEPRKLPSATGPEAGTITTGTFTRNPNSPSAGLKSVSYADNLLALRWAVARGFDEYAFLTHEGLLAEGTRSNLLVSVAGRWVTPGVHTGCLAGIGREVLIEAGLIEEEDIRFEPGSDRPVSELARCTAGLVDELVWVSSAGGVRYRADGLAGVGPGPLALAAWAELNAYRL